MAKFNETLSCLIALEVKEATSTPQNKSCVVPHNHNELAFSTKVHTSWKNTCELARALGCKDMNAFFLRETHGHKTINVFASRGKHMRTKPWTCFLYMRNTFTQSVTRVCFIPCVWWVLYLKNVWKRGITPATAILGCRATDLVCSSRGSVRTLEGRRWRYKIYYYTLQGSPQKIKVEWYVILIFINIGHESH